MHEKIQEERAIFFWIEHKLRKEELEKQFNREAKEGWRFAADAARITDERAGGEDQSIRQEEYLCQSTATWEQLWERKKVRLFQSQVLSEELPKHG